MGEVIEILKKCLKDDLNVESYDFVRGYYRGVLHSLSYDPYLLLDVAHEIESEKLNEMLDNFQKRLEIVGMEHRNRKIEHIPYYYSTEEDKE